MLLRRRLGRSTDDRLQEEIIPHHQGELGVDVSPDEDLEGVASQAAEVDVLGEGAGHRALDFTLDEVSDMLIK